VYVIADTLVKVAGYCALWKEAVPRVWVPGARSQEISRHCFSDRTANGLS